MTKTTKEIRVKTINEILVQNNRKGCEDVRTKYVNLDDIKKFCNEKEFDCVHIRILLLNIEK